MAEKKEYRNAVRSRRMIRGAFEQLLREKPFEQITVAEIVRRADINRSTFYAHYQDIWALVEEYENEVLEYSMEQLRQMDLLDFLRDPLAWMQQLCRPLEQNRELYRLLGRSEPVVKQMVRQMERVKMMMLERTLSAADFPEQLQNSISVRIKAEFFIGGVFAVYQDWVNGKLECSADELSQAMAEVVGDAAQEVLQLMTAEG